MGASMDRELLPDDLWEFMKPFIPPRKRRFRYPVRKPVDDRACMTGILFILRTGLPWEYLPKELGCGSGVTPPRPRRGDPPDQGPAARKRHSRAAPADGGRTRLAA